MTGDTMKSDFTMDSKYRSEGRHSLPRRRVATKTSHENGDFEMELSLAIKESLKYAKEKEGQLKRVDRTSPLLNGVQTDESFSRMAGKMLSFATSSDQGQGSEEIQQLKDLLLIHIELIQHQQELLANKDKEIRTLRNEKDTLQCRLQKAEKRVAQMKQKEDLLEAQIADAKDAAAIAAAQVEAAAFAGPPEKHKVAKPEQMPGRKRRQRQHTKSKRQAKVRKQTEESDKASESVTSFEEEDSGAEESESAEDEEDDEDREDELSSDVVRGEEKTESKEEEGGSGSENEDNMLGAEDRNKDPYPAAVLRTECAYHVSCCVEQVIEEPVEIPEEKEVFIGDQVETPGWRINVLTNRYQLEGTENITDEAYQKRHQKHEMEERRRKRWDIQRMREQRVFEKLRGKEESAAQSAQDDQSLRTFLPNIEDLTHIEILDSVAVMAFGQAVPHIEPSEFELPWDTGPSSSFTRRSHGGRGRLK